MRYMAAVAKFENGDVERWGEVPVGHAGAVELNAATIFHQSQNYAVSLDMGITEITFTFREVGNG